jgi:hypothetical protein
MSRIGKIARLPRHIREELNRRIDDGAQGTQLVAWLNEQPDAQRVLQDSFEGRPITEGNLTEWKQGGYLDWQQHRETREWAHFVTEESDQAASQSGIVPLSDRLSAMVTRTLGMRIRQLASDPGTSSESGSTTHEELMELLDQFTRLRRDDHEAARLRMESESYEIDLRYRLRNHGLTAVPHRS